mmetsp:Transcript_4188/g.6425  ORF Transcript_4188/g.6425 Transcript_4188/m.6425 type:complete len:245 (-) Transcript_4188:41-775(-)
MHFQQQPLVIASDVDQRALPADATKAYPPVVLIGAGNGDQRGIEKDLVGVDAQPAPAVGHCLQESTGPGNKVPSATTGRLSPYEVVAHSVLMASLETLDGIGRVPYIQPTDCFHALSHSGPMMEHTRLIVVEVIMAGRLGYRELQGEGQQNHVGLFDALVTPVPQELGMYVAFGVVEDAQVGGNVDPILGHVAVGFGGNINTEGKSKSKGSVGGGGIININSKLISGYDSINRIASVFVFLCPR